MRPYAKFSRDWRQGNKEKEENGEERWRRKQEEIGQLYGKLLEIKIGDSSSCKELFLL